MRGNGQKGFPNDPHRTPHIMVAHEISTMVLTMDITELDDDDLLAHARDWRQRALRGEKDARGIAHELECEVRRRLPKNEGPQGLTPLPLLGALSQPAWRRWKLF